LRDMAAVDRNGTLGRGARDYSVRVAYNFLERNDAPECNARAAAWSKAG